MCAMWGEARERGVHDACDPLWWCCCGEEETEIIGQLIKVMLGQLIKVTLEKT